MRYQWCCYMGTMCATVVGILIEVVCLNWNELVSDYLQSRYCLKLLELVCRRTSGGRQHKRWRPRQAQKHER